MPATLSGAPPGRFTSILAALTVAAMPLAGQSPLPWNVETPTGPTRTAAFEVGRGTWMSVSVSPDGRALAFVLLGHISEMPSGGGGARRVSSGRSWNLVPR
jgi:hypothetical protein